MKYVQSLLLVCFAFFVVGCSSASSPNPTLQIQNQSFLQGKVLMAAQEQVIVQTPALELADEYESKFAYLAAKVAQKTLLIRGLETQVNGQKAAIEDIRGTSITFRFDKPTTLQASHDVSVYIPRKTVAITGFEAIRRTEKKIPLSSQKRVKFL